MIFQLFLISFYKMSYHQNHFYLNGICKNCGQPSCLCGQSDHSFDINGICRICNTPACQLGRWNHDYDNRGICKRCGSYSMVPIL